MKRLLLAAAQGAVAGALVGTLVQFVDVGGELDLHDSFGRLLEQWLRRAVIGAGSWAGAGVALSWAFSWARGRWWAWSLAVLVILGGLTACLAVAGMVGLGFATRFAWLQAVSLIGTCGAGVWLAGVLALTPRPPSSGG